MGFDEALKQTLAFEGGYANDPDDRGGETFRGISRRSFPDWPGWALIDRAKREGDRSARAINARFVGDMEMEGLVARLYRENFWNPFNGGGA